MMLKLIGALGADYTGGKGAVWPLEHAWKPELVHDAVGVVAMNHQGLGAGDAVPLEELGLVDFVGAAHDRFRVVNHDQAIGLSTPGETIRMVIDRRRLANEQSIELTQTTEVVLLDQRDAHGQALAGAHESL